MHSARLCFLLGAFIPFIFKVIIDTYVPIAIVLVVWGLFSFSSSLPLLSFSLSFLPRQMPLAIVVIDLVVLNSL